MVVRTSKLRLGVMKVFHMQGSWFETLCLLLKHVLQESKHEKKEKKTVEVSETWITIKLC